MASKDAIKSVSDFIKKISSSGFITLPDDIMSKGLKKAYIRISKLEEFNAKSGQYPNGNAYLLVDSTNKDRSR